MLRNIALLAALVLLAGCGTGPVVWQKTIATDADEVAAGLDADTLTVVVSATTGAGEQTRWLVARFDTDGNELWRRNWGEAGVNTCGGIALGDGGIFVTGRAQSGDVPVCVVVKYTLEGNIAWQKGLALGDKSWGRDVCALEGGACAVTGAAGTDENIDLMITRLESDGRTAWARNYDFACGDAGQAIAAGPNGRLAVIAVAGTAENNDIMTLCFGPNGDTLWTRTYDSGSLDIPGGVTFDAFGNIVATGTVRTTDSVRCVILEYDKDGGVIREAAFGERAQAEGRAVAASPDGDLFVAGIEGKDALARMFAFHYVPNATSIWQRTLKTAGPSGAAGIAAPADVYVCGTEEGKKGDVVVARFSRPPAKKQ
jgi:hypothetical protein